LARASQNHWVLVPPSPQWNDPTVARKRDLERDARQRATEVPGYALQESVEALEAALPAAVGDLQLWLQAALEALRARQHLSTVSKSREPAQKRKSSPS
jgi:hypothetical protein